MIQKLSAFIAVAIAATSTAFGQGYVTFNCVARTVWDNFNGPTPGSASPTNADVTFLWAPAGTSDPLAGYHIGSNSVAAISGTAWGVIGNMLTNGWQVAYNLQTSTYAILQPNGNGSVIYGQFELANAAPGSTIEIAVVGWDAASGTNVIFSEEGQALGCTYPINYVTGTNSFDPNGQAEFATGRFGIVPAPTVPSISSQPESQTVLVGETATFTVAAFGGLPEYYQWFFNGTALDGATNDELQLTNLTEAADGPYWVMVSNSFGSATSSNAYLTVTPPSPPVIVNQPTNFVATAYGPASFNVTATGTFPLSFQWSQNGSNILNATNSIFYISSVRQSDLGQYSVLVTNAYGAVMSSAANLDMYPYIQSPFPGLDTYWGQTNTVGVGAWGSGTLTYQWYQNGVALPGDTNSTLTFSAIQFTSAGSYYVVVSSALGSATNSAYQVVVNPANVSFKISPDVVIQGTVGYSYIVESTTNLSDPNAWIVETNLTLTQPIENWNDNSVDMNSRPRKFYQVLPGQ